ncbi:MAG: S-layer protein [Candidatus Micrarchaeia archaeon]
MKSINAKKLAAVTLGAALLGASFVAAAPIMYKNTQIINEQGKPVVKVVVGANAKASDGVAAANIAAVIGSLAYKTQTVSAQLTGTPTCSVTGTGTGTCPVSDKKVTLEITTPGTATVAGGFGFKTYGYGFIDNVQTTEDDQINNSGSPKKITGDNMAALADYKSSVSSVSGSFTETQEMYVEQILNAPAWDADAQKYYIRPDRIEYVIKFDHDTFGGVPICVKESQLALNTTCEEDYKIDRQRLKIKYLGEEWIISDMTNGTSVKIAKEATPAQIVYAGQEIAAGAYKVKLADLTIPYGSTDSQAIVQIYDANGNLVKEDTAASGATKEITLPNGDKISLHIYKTAPGLTTAKWAEMAVYSQEIELKNGKVDDDKNKNWTVTLGWTNRSSEKLNSILKNITFERVDFDDIKEGQAVNIIESPAPFQFKFAGWTLTDANRDNLKVEWKRISSYYNTTTDTTTNPISDSDERDFVCFTSDKKAFGSSFTYTYNSTNSTTGSLEDDRSQVCYGIKTGYVMYDKPDKGYVLAAKLNMSASNQYVLFDYKINDDSSYDNKLNISVINNASANVTLNEYLLKDTTRANATGYFQFVADQPNRRFVNNLGDNSESKVVVGYLGNNAQLLTANREAGFVSQKGSVIASRSASSITFKMAKKLGEFQYFLMPSSSTVSEGTSTQTLSEGQQVTVQESTVKVKEISATVGACSVSGGSAACTASSAGMSAVLDVAGTPASASFAVPYKMSSTERLVVLDSEAPTAESLILVGGQLVNSLTASAIAGTDVKIDKPGVKVVSAVSDNRIVVAGYTADDTQQAAADFISQLLAQVQ